MRRGSALAVVGVAALGVVAALVGLPPMASGQEAPVLRVQADGGGTYPVTIDFDRGYAAIGAYALESLGWSLVWEGDLAHFAAPAAVLDVVPGSPLFSLDGELLQLSFPPYGDGGELHVPLQLLSDFLPRRYPDRYSFDGPTMILRAGPAPGAGNPVATEAAQPVARTEVAPPPAPEPEPQGRPAEAFVADTLSPPRGAENPVEAAVPDTTPPASAAPQLPDEPSSYEGPRVVVIDAGHGGYDPGSIGISGVREKSVVLGVALALAEELRREPELEVHLLRDDDTFIELWDRGQLATDVKGERPGIFISIHANSFPQRRSATGFETYFLSEARTDHERRVAAIENAPMHAPGAPGATGDLDFILRELRNLDHQHWSALLAENIQQEMERIHPGPNRGVKQGPMAVITNALMPSVLVELGYLSNAQEERLLAQQGFQQDAAGAIAQAVMRFFRRYPPESGMGSGQGVGDGSGGAGESR